MTYQKPVRIEVYPSGSRGLFAKQLDRENGAQVRILSLLPNKKERVIKMARTYITSDHHFDHRNILKYEEVRSFRWSTVEQMNEDLISIWNSIVKPEDRVYHLGDISMGKSGLEFARRLNGRKILIKGNHDLQKLKDYVEIFDDIRASHSLDNVILTHIPVHEGQKHRYRANIHGHLHSKRVLNGLGEIDPWYISACVELNDFKPVTFENMMKGYKNEN